jgi:hypothetical protein
MSGQIDAKGLSSVSGAKGKFGGHKLEIWSRDGDICVTADNTGYRLVTTGSRRHRHTVQHMFRLWGKTVCESSGRAVCLQLYLNSS